ncbi:response regulator [Neptuniibacter halophilus]|uniref:response regulator n=1 Tax=Neptuniibacter halophilus TaxID=651666 RepID=UPI002572E5EF|nr:response regulator [Neptuniibacter halophilus]
MKTFSTGDIAKFCDVNLRTVIRWIEKGELKGFKLPGRGNNRVTEEELVKFFQRHQMPIPKEVSASADTARTVLIVDDDVQVGRAIQRVLRRAGYRTLLAEDGFRAGTLLMSEKPAIMTLDLSMPGLDGFAVIRFVRESAEIRDTRILVISALDKRQLQAALASGADACLEKPFANEQLLHRVSQLLKPTFTATDRNECQAISGEPH